MKKLTTIPLLVFAALVTLAGLAAAQSPKASQIIFAVENSGRSIEPIAKIVDGHLVKAASGDDDGADIVAFHKVYYRANIKYHLIFGGVDSGTVAVTKADPNEECDKAMADVTTNSSKAKLNGVVMGLATDVAPLKPGSGLRRKATPGEHAAIEKLVAAEFAKNQAGGHAIHFQNLTVFDVANDGIPEFVGSAWVELSPTERALLFFIGSQEKGSGEYSFGYSDFRTVKQDELLGSIQAVEVGRILELVLDVLDIDGDGTAEIFTIDEWFEGAGFSVYSRKGGKWAKVFEGGDYRCAF